MAPGSVMLNPKDIPDCRAVLIAGPTASGKSRLAVEIAAERGGTVINADSMQVYSCWRILTARPGRQDMGHVPHRLFGHVQRRQKYSTGSWLREVSEILSKDDCGLPVIVGGTGLYFRALTEGLAEIPPVDPEVRAEGQKMQDKFGPGYFAGQLRRLDPQTFQQLDQLNPARIVRAWEVLETTGRGLKSWQNETPPPLLNMSETFPVLLDPCKLVNAARIDGRLRRMVKSGALGECAGALADWDPKLPSSKAIGACELISYLQGQISLAAAIERAQVLTRRFAKRQRTWFRTRMKGWHSYTLL